MICFASDRMRAPYSAARWDRRVAQAQMVVQAETLPGAGVQMMPRQGRADYVVWRMTGRVAMRSRFTRLWGLAAWDEA